VLGHGLTRVSSAAALTLMALLALAGLPQHAVPQTAPRELVLVLDPAASKVHWTLDSSLHTVHGTFAFKNGALHVYPGTGKAGGEIIADAASGNSGNDSRDKKMHKEVLESGRYGEVVFRPDRVAGTIATPGTSAVQVHGTFVLHGSEHELTVPVQAELGTDHWTGSSKFDVPFIDWGLKNPGNFFLKVNHRVNIELELKGRLESPVAP